MLSRFKLFCAVAVSTVLTVSLFSMTGCGSGSSNSVALGLPNGKATLAQVTLGRQIAVDCGCGDCHSQGATDPSAPIWMSGASDDPFGPGNFDFGPLGITHAPNLTPGGVLAGATSRQVFNALRWGLDPGDSRTDKVINSTADFPANPKYVAPPMPWPAYRNKPDKDLWAIVAYLKYGLKSNPHTVPDSTPSPDGWASFYAGTVGSYPVAPFPTSTEQFSP